MPNRVRHISLRAITKLVPCLIVAIAVIQLSAVPFPSVASNTGASASTFAWRYFEYGDGINPTSLLPRGWIGGDSFNFWDFGMAIDATVAAHKDGLVSQTDYQLRINALLSFLENMQLNSNGVPYYSYKWDSGAPASNGGMDAADTGRTLSALGFLRRSDPSYASRIDSLLLGRLKPWIDAEASWATVASFQVYDRDASLGLTYFRYLNSQYDRTSWLNSFYNAWASTTERISDSYGNSMPKVGANLGPVSYELFEKGDDYFRTLRYAKDMMGWAANRYAATGKVSVWGSEFHVKLSDGSTPFAWELYVACVPDVDCRTWQVKVLNGPWLDENDPSLTSTVSSTDAAYALHATFTTNPSVISMTEKFTESDLVTNYGFSEAMFEVTNIPERTVSISHNTVILLAETSGNSFQVGLSSSSGNGYATSLGFAAGNLFGKWAICSEERAFAMQLPRILVKSPPLLHY